MARLSCWPALVGLAVVACGGDVPLADAALSPDGRLADAAPSLDGRLADVAPPLDGRLADAAFPLDGPVVDAALSLDGTLADAAPPPDGPLVDAAGPRDAAPPDAAPLPDGPGGDAGPRSLTVTAVHTDTTRLFRTADRGGTLFAVDPAAGDNLLFASVDRGQSWSYRGRSFTGSFARMTALADGTLLADTDLDATHTLARSTDGGVTWDGVLGLGAYRILQPHAIQELDGSVFLADYQAAIMSAAPTHIYASPDGGATWAVRYTFTTVRHAHGLVADATTGALWALLGDTDGGLWRSLDLGASWHEVLHYPDGIAVDAVVTPRGLLYGADLISLPNEPGVRLITPGLGLERIAPLPGPSYSIIALAGGGFLLGTTREPEGDVYPPGDDSAHLFGSADGVVWNEVGSWPRLDPTDYGRADVYVQLPSGEAVLQLHNVAGMGESGHAFVLLEPRIE